MAYLYYRTITIDHTKVPSDLVNFPVLVSFTNASLKTTGNGGNVTSASGFDIILSSTADLSGADKIAHEIEKYTATTGEVIFWAKVAAVSSSVDTIIYVLYGNSAIVTSQEAITSVWDSNFLGVFHLKDEGAVDLDDSTSNNKDLVLVTGGGPAAVVTGQIAEAADYTSNYYNATSYPNIVFPLTFEFWVNSDALQDAAVLGHTAGGNNGIRAGIENNGSGAQRCSYTLGGVISYSFSTLTFATAGWVYVAVRLNSTGLTCKIFKGDSSLTSESQTVLNTFAGTANVLAVAARDATPNSPLNGKIDEIRYSTIDRADGWITACYNNQKSPSTFFALGSEVTSVLTITASDTLSLSDGQALNVGLLISFADSVSFTDDVTNNGPDPAISQTDTLSLSDGIAVIMDLMLQLNDTLSLNDNAALLQDIRLTKSDTLSLSDAVSINGLASQEITDVLLLTDELTLMLGIFLSLSDTFVFTDSAQVAMIQQINVSDTLQLLDSITLALNFTVLSLTFSDTLVLADTASVALANASTPIPPNNLPYYRRYLNDV